MAVDDGIVTDKIIMSIADYKCHYSAITTLQYDQVYSSYLMVPI